MDMPVGIVGCISFVTIVYTLLALALVLMVPYTEIDTAASFATAFSQVGYPWGQVRWLTLNVVLTTCIYGLTDVDQSNPALHDSPPQIFLE